MRLLVPGRPARLRPGPRPLDLGLHVNGTARVVGAGEANGARPRVERWVEVRVREAYIHCRKHLPHQVKVTGEARPWVAE